MLAFTLAVSLLTGVLFGLAPAWRATSLDLATSLKQKPPHNGRGVAFEQRADRRAGRALVVLLVGAGLFIRTLYNLQRVNLGFNQENLLLFRLQPQQSGYKDERLLQFYQQLFARLDNLPGVRAATFGKSRSSRMTIGSMTFAARRDGTDRCEARDHAADGARELFCDDGNSAAAWTRLHRAR